MKKPFLLLPLFFCVFILHSTTKAQSPTAPNFTIPDINLNHSNWDLYTLLAQGKTVIIDLSAPWCAACWSQHRSGKLQQLYEHYGPNGTLFPDKIAVFMINTDPGDSFGDEWKTGITYPILQATQAQVQSIEAAYQYFALPAYLVICPDKSWTSSFLDDENTLVGIINSSCPFSRQLIDAAPGMCYSTTACGTSFSPKITLSNCGHTTLNSCIINYSIDNGTIQTYNWSGTLASGNTADVDLPAYTLIGSGNHALHVNTSLPNGYGKQ